MTPEEIRAFIAELEQLAGTLASPIEGLNDVERLNVSNEAKSASASRRNLLVNFESILSRAADVLRELLGAGWPALPPTPLPQILIDEIAEQERTLAAARAQFTPQSASVLTSTGAVAPKLES